MQAGEGAEVGGRSSRSEILSSGVRLASSSGGCANLLKKRNSPAGWGRARSGKVERGFCGFWRLLTKTRGAEGGPLGPSPSEEALGSWTAHVGPAAAAAVAATQELATRQSCLPHTLHSIRPAAL